MADLAKDLARFEQVVERLLEANNFRIGERQTLGVDFAAAFNDYNYLIEVKYYRTARPQVSLIETAAARLLEQISSANGRRRGMLVLSCNLSLELREALEKKFGLLFIDRVDLFAWAAKAPDVADELNALLEDRTASSTPDPRRNFANSFATVTHVPPVAPPPKDTTGSDLCRELRALKRGKTTWAAYERLCDKILRYLFPNDLVGWHTQKRTDDGLSRFDYICRIIPGTDFWSFLVDHLNTRYVLFEFKNYTGKIKQGQILTTEKYLLEKGLRRVAIVVSRAGAEKNAIKLAQGAMREAGKLMLILDDDRVCEMLHRRERGDDPTDLLFDLADDFLLSLPR